MAASGNEWASCMTGTALQFDYHLCCEAGGVMNANNSLGPNEPESELPSSRFSLTICAALFSWSLQPTPNACPVPGVLLAEPHAQISLCPGYYDERYQSNRGQQRDQRPGTVDPHRDSKLK